MKSFHFNPFPQTFYPKNEVEGAKGKDFRNKQDSSAPVFVVGLIGKTKFGKGLIVDQILGKNVFKRLHSENIIQKQSETSKGITNSCRIDAYYYVEQNILFLNLISIMDHEVLHGMCQLEEIANSSPADFHLWLEKQEYHTQKAMLYLFIISHQIFVIQENGFFDLRYLKVFRALQSIKLAINSSVLSYLNETIQISDFKSIPLSYPGKCVPHLGLIVRQKLAPHLVSKSFALPKDISSQITKNAREVLEKSLETQISMLLKKGRILSSDSPLFTLDEFSVFVIAETSEPDPISQLLSSSISEFMADYFPHSEANLGDVETLDGIGRLKEYILKKAKSLVQNRKVPPFRTWTSMVHNLQDLFLYGHKKPGRYRSESGGDLIEKLKSYIDPDYKFSTSRCISALPSAKSQYLLNLPPYYTTQIHEKHFQKALQVFYQQTKGPACEHYESKLREDCTKIWKSGRQMCDAVSLTGRPCIYQIHDIPNGSETLSENVKYHSSSYKSLNACSCGRTREIREDPFTIENSNMHSIKLAEKCCNFLTSFTFSSEHYWSLHRFGAANYYQHEIGLLQDGFLPGTNFLLPLHLFDALNFQSGLPLKEKRKEPILEENLLTKESNLEEIIERGRSYNAKQAEVIMAHQMQIHQKQQTKGKSRNKPKPNKTDNQTPQSFIGYEYECPIGHRFFLSPNMDEIIKGLTNHSLSYDQKVNLIISSHLPLFVPCQDPKCKEKPNNSAKLQRIFLVTPDVPSLLMANPRIKFFKNRPDSGMEECLFSCGSEVILPRNSFLCLYLPYVFCIEGQPLLQRENAIFMKGSFYLGKES